MNSADISTNDEFQEWLASLDDIIDVFTRSVPRDIRSKLNYTLDSLDYVEQYLLDKYLNIDQVILPSESLLVNGAAAYVGEVYRKHTGGKWNIILDDPEFVFVGLPILVGGRNQRIPECPFTLCTAAVDRRTGHYLKQVLWNSPSRDP